MMKCTVAGSGSIQSQLILNVHTFVSAVGHDRCWPTDIQVTSGPNETLDRCLHKLAPAPAGWQKPPWEVRVTLSHDACPWCEE